MLDDNRIKKLTLLKPGGCRRVGRPKVRWMEWRMILGCVVCKDGDEVRWTGGNGKMLWRWPGPKLGL
jgi:hypothetical protein